MEHPTRRTQPPRPAARAWTAWCIAGSMLALACIPAAAADDQRVGGGLTAQTVFALGDTKQNGSVSMFKAWDDEPSRSPGTVWLAFEAATVEATIYNITGFNLVVFSLGLRDLDFEDAPSTEWKDTDVQAELQGFTPRFHLQGFTQGGPLGLQARSEDVSVRALQAAYMDRERISEAGPADSGSTGEESWFQSVRMDAPHVLVDVESGGSTIEVTGDFTLELTGLHLNVEGDSGSRELDTRRTATPIVPDVPPETLGQDDRHFARLHLTGARLVFTMEGGEHLTQWASPGLESTTLGGQLTLHGAEGSFEGEPVRDGRLVVQEPYQIHLRPDGSRLHLDAVPTDAKGNPLEPSSGAFHLPTGWLAASLWTLASLLLLAIIGCMGWVSVQRFRLPGMPQVEDALEAGRYARAARMAARILSQEPASEAARVARSVALSRQGRPQQVVDEIVGHLAEHRPSDGVLHYVLGLAYMELGKDEDAREAFRSAVTRTPALEHQVAPHLLVRSGWGATGGRDGEAQAYA